MACGDVLSLEDLQTAKKHQTFEAEVITGKAGGVAGGTPIDYATNQVTGQTQKTLPSIMRDLGFEPAQFDFAGGGTLAVSDRNKAVLWPVFSGGDGYWYYWEGVLPKVIPAGSTPASSGGVADGAWQPVGDITLREDLAKSDGADLIGASIYSNIRSYTGSAEKIYCIGRANIFDRAGGWFKRSITDTTSPDDDGIILIDALGRRWKRVYGGRVSPCWWGASGVDDGSDCILAFEAAAKASRCIDIPEGIYGFSRSWVLTRERMRISGAGNFGPYGSAVPIGGSGGTLLKPLAGFSPTTVGGSTGAAVIWYQNPIGNWDSSGWIDGGLFENFSIDCVDGAVEGIRTNRICNGHKYSNITISNPSIGIYGTHFGWLTKFDNVFVYQPRIIGIRLNSAFNGCTFSGCGLYGGNIKTQVLIDMAYDCYGNIWNGGFIEGGLVAVRLTNAQLSFYGTDFEAIDEKFFEVKGVFSGASLVAANPTIMVNGCTFVGAPIVAGIEVNGGFATVSGNFFINTGSLPLPGVYCLNGILGGDVTPGYEAQCIAEENNTWRGWGSHQTSGIVFSRFKRVATDGVTFSSTNVSSTNPNTLDDYEEGVFTPAMAGTGWGGGMVAAGKYTKIGNIVNFSVKLTGSTNSSVRTSSFLTGFPAQIVTPSTAVVSDAYNTNHGAVAVVSGSGNIIVYMPTISSTPATVIVTGSYFTE